MVESLSHALFECPSNQGLQKYVPRITPQDVLKLNFEVDEELDFPIVWCTATFLSSLRQLRTEKKRVELETNSDYRNYVEHFQLNL